MAESPSVAQQLARSFEVLEREMPGAYERVCRGLSDMVLELGVDRERFTVRFAADQAEVIAGPPEAPVVTVTTDRQTILAVIDAQTTLDDAVRHDRVVIRGALADIARVHHGLLAYVHGGVRSPTFPTLLSHFRAGTP